MKTHHGVTHTYTNFDDADSGPALYAYVDIDGTTMFSVNQAWEHNNSTSPARHLGWLAKEDLLRLRSLINAVLKVLP